LCQRLQGEEEEEEEEEEEVLILHATDYFYIQMCNSMET